MFDQLLSFVMVKSPIKSPCFRSGALGHQASCQAADSGQGAVFFWDLIGDFDRMIPLRIDPIDDDDDDVDDDDDDDYDDDDDDIYR